jgi:purine-binding chemotaxis protein CheW
VSTPTTRAAAPTTQQLVVLALGSEEYAVPIGHVQEIISYTAPRPVPSSDPCCRGVISLRGKIIPVFDLAMQLGVFAEPADDQRIVILEGPAGIAGVIVDDVDEVLEVDESDFEPMPQSGSAAVESVVEMKDRLIVLLAPDRLLEGLI